MSPEDSTGKGAKDLTQASGDFFDSRLTSDADVGPNFADRATEISGRSGNCPGENVESVPLSATESLSPNSSQIGQQIGPYKLLHLLGEGGMGTVYLAEQREPVHRRVALKIIKAGTDSGQVVARFEAERQALAMMDHPNIARVLDAGSTESGSPFFVMELVKGIPITQYCDRNKLEIRQRLDLFIDVCNAVQHAHQKGIIHRDLKPSNILVTLHDDKPIPKVIDFGVAKATNQRLTEKTMFTAYGQVVGTLEYMSPEQAQMTDLDIDTRSDIYSLGVLLYELLTGSTPLKRESLREAAFLDVLRRIREEEPPRPSTRVSESQETLGSISALRRVEPRRFSLLIKGDLDWIVLKSLEKDRTRRYETANAFSADLRRFLEDEPIAARPPSAMYRFEKMARKNRVLFGFLGTVAAMLLIGIGVSSYLARWAISEAQKAKAATSTAEAETDKTRKALRLAEQHRNEAETRQAESQASAERAQAILDVLVSSFRGVHPHLQEYLGSQHEPGLLDDEGPAEDIVASSGKDLLARDVLINAWRQMETDELLDGFPLAKADLMSAISSSLRGLEDYSRALEIIEQEFEIRMQHQNVTDPELIECTCNLARVLTHTGDQKRAAEILQELLEQQVTGEHVKNRINLNGTLAWMRSQQGLHEEAITLRKENLDLSQSLSTDAQNDAMFWLAIAYSVSDSRGKAVTLLEESLKDDLAMLHAGELPTAYGRIQSLATCYLNLGQFDRAIELSKKYLDVTYARKGFDHPFSSWVEESLASAYRKKGDHKKAIELYESALERRRRVFGDESTWAFNSIVHLARALWDNKDFDRANQLYDEALRKQRENLGEDHPTTLATLDKLAWGYRESDDHAKAIELYESILDKRREHLGEEHPKTLDTIHNLAWSQQENEDLDRAIELYEAVLVKRRKVLGEENTNTLNTINNLANTYRSKGDFLRAIELHEIALEKRRATLGEDNDNTRQSQRNLASALLDSAEASLADEKYVAAESAIRRSIDLYDEAKYTGYRKPAALCLLAAALSHQEDFDEATETFIVAFDELKRRTSSSKNRFDSLKWGVEHFHRSQNQEMLERYEPEYNSLKRRVSRLDQLATSNKARNAGDPNPFRSVVDLEASLRSRLVDKPDDHETRIEACFYARYLLSQYLKEEESDKVDDARGRVIADLLYFREHTPDGHPESFVADGELELLHVFGLNLATSGKWTVEDSIERIDTVLPKASDASKSQVSRVLNDEAWSLATSPTAQPRDGSLAVTMSKIACRHCTSKLKPGYLDTLAAAYARAGDFGKAIEVMKQAVELEKNPKFADEFRQRLERYKSAEPYSIERES